MTSSSLKNIQLFSGSSNPELSKKVAQALEIPLGRAILDKYPSGDSNVKLEDEVHDRDVFIIQPTSPPTNHHLMELFMMIDAAKRGGANRITTVIPYYGYARQDRKEDSRIPITAKLVANLLVKSGADRIITMDLHAPQIQGFFDVPVDNLYALPIVIKYIKSKNLDNFIVVSPDAGGVKNASRYAEALGASIGTVAKKRNSATSTEVLYVIGDVKDKNVLIVDDMTETGGTLAQAANTLKAAGAKKIYACVSHAVFTPDAHAKLSASGIDEMICTDTLPLQNYPKNEVTVLSIADLLAQAIKAIHLGQPMAPLFELQ
jgi:ribose-phosphate pyrophosphokinase